MDTFVVRVWSSGDGEVGEALRGVVEHVSTGASDRFRNAEELLSFLRSPRPTERVLSGGDEDPPSP